MQDGGQTKSSRAVLLPEQYVPLGILQRVGQPQGVCTGGPWGAE